MISLNVGPSQVYAAIGQFLQDAFEQGILSIPHRGEEFTRICQKAIRAFKEKLKVPDNYEVLFVSSATECWQIIAYSLITQKSYHIFNGSFGERWWKNTQAISGKAESFPLEISEKIDAERIHRIFSFAERRGGQLIKESKELICITQSETSNGSQFPLRLIDNIHESFPEQLIAVDATSSMGGLEFKWQAADVWFASVQKCFGLPAGLAVMVVSPRAIARAYEVCNKVHYNNLVSIIENMHRYQTTHTPNVLGVYLMQRVLETIGPIEQIENILIERSERYYAFFDKLTEIQPLIDHLPLRSRTVIALKGEPERITDIKHRASEAGFRLANGYGPWKENTFRIANFPAITNEQVDKLLDFLRSLKL